MRLILKWEEIYYSSFRNKEKSCFNNKKSYVHLKMLNFITNI